MEEKLKRALANRQKLYIKDASLTPSAVLLPVFRKDGVYHTLFTRRTDKVRVHKGEISFPGGACEEQDGILLNTALRECAEEIGLAGEAVKILGELDDMPTLGSDYVISPFVAAIPSPYPFKLDPGEVGEIIEVPIPALLDKDCVTEEVETWRGQPITTYSYRYGNEVIWGASARILHQFLDVWVRATRDYGGN